MATPSKKAVAKVPAKKVVKTTASVAAKPVKKEKVAAPKKTVSLTAFSVTATIPTMPYGNIMPTISVIAQTIEEARDTVMPFIEELYAKYAEKPRDGSRPAFLGKITETVKEVAPIVAPAPVEAPKPVPMPAQAPEAAVEVPTAPVAAEAPTEAPKAAVSEFAARAEKMINLALTEEAAERIKLQIQNSEKIPAEEKPALLELVEAKLTDFQSNVW